MKLKKTLGINKLIAVYENPKEKISISCVSLANKELCKKTSYLLSQLDPSIVTILDLFNHWFNQQPKDR
eukprot:UN17082